jgi:basic membrane protein A
MRRVSRIAVATVATATLAVTASACGSSSSESAGSGDKSKGVALAYDVGGKGDQSFNDAATAGMEKAATDFDTGSKAIEPQDGESDADKVQRLEQLAKEGYNPVIGVGFAYSDAVNAVAPDYPKINFGVIDGYDPDKNPNKNVAYLGFAENEGSFLVGVAAAEKTKTDHIGFVGGVHNDLIKKFEAGYVAGAKKINPDITVDIAYITQPPDFTGFNDPAKGQTAGAGMYDAGADVVYAAAGGSGGGVFKAAKAGNKLAIGVDSDQYKTADPAVQGVIMTSMLKKVDVAVYDFIKDAADGTYTAGPKVFDLKAGGVDYSTSGGKVDDIKSKLDDYKQQIIDGKITVPSK